MKKLLLKLFTIPLLTFTFKVFSVQNITSNQKDFNQTQCTQYTNNDIVETLITIAEITAQNDPILLSTGFVTNEILYHFMTTLITQLTRNNFLQLILATHEEIIAEAVEDIVESEEEASQEEIEKTIEETWGADFIQSLLRTYQALEHYSDQEFEQLKEIAIKELTKEWELY